MELLPSEGAQAQDAIDAILDESAQEQLAGLDGIISLSLQEAAGGMCSLRSLKIIGAIHLAEKSELRDAQIQDNAAGVASPIRFQPFKLKKRLGEQGQLVMLESDQPRVTRLAYHHMGTNKVLELWKLVEASKDSQDCSYAVFMPYLDQKHQIDFSLVVSKDDEEKPHSVEGLLYEGKGLTNAKVLDMLLSRINDDDADSQLVDAIKLNDLISYSGVAIRDGQTYQSIEGSSASTPLSAWIGKVASWAELSGGPVTYRKEYKDTTEICVTIAPDAAANITTQHKDLGTYDRMVRHGSLHAVDNDMQIVEEASGATALTELAAYALEIPEIIVDTDLQESVQEIVRREHRVSNVNFHLKHLVSQFRETHKVADDTIVDLGHIDARHLSSGELALLHEFDSIRVQINGHPDLDVFADGNNLYDCSVDVANRAFNSCDAVTRCSTNNVHKSFVKSYSVDCLAMNGDFAFIMGGATLGCMAINMGGAFDGQKLVINCYAKNCGTAFADLYGQLSSVVAEDCRLSFIDVTKGADNCQVLNPKLLGLSWSAHGRPRGRNKNNRIVGRVLGKNFARLRGVYRKAARQQG